MLKASQGKVTSSSGLVHGKYKLKHNTISLKTPKKEKKTCVPKDFTEEFKIQLSLDLSVLTEESIHNGRQL